MQRQSLGSPVSKLHSNGGLIKEEKFSGSEEDCKKNVSANNKTSAVDEEEDKLHRSHHRADKFIHLIPLLTFLCFFLLYLCSHNPSQLDLAEFNGNKRMNSKDNTKREISERGRYVEIEKSEVVGIGSLRNLQEVGTSFVPKSRLHRSLDITWPVTIHRETEKMLMSSKQQAYASYGNKKKE
ncbi:hypothetical protein RJ641_000857 [Dillenia turbinata]|uniref:Uncharacterized protein n=1 Tax=Dillenia turbinata TaxID=194707 RepID=A0AAN8ZMR0_9MAGN